MLRSTATALAFAAALFALASLDAVNDTLARAAIAVGLGTAVTSLAFGRLTFVPVVVGALSPLVFVWLEKSSVGIAASALCFLWMAPRLILAETRVRLAWLIASLAVASIVAGLIFASYLDAPWIVHAASCVFAGSCLSLVRLIPVETSVSFALRTTAAAIDSPAREALERAARAHRESQTSTTQAKQWRALLRLADERAALGSAKNGDDGVRGEVDERIAALVAELAQANGVATVEPEETPGATPTGATTTVPAPAASDPSTESFEVPVPTQTELSFDAHAQEAPEPPAE
jgi:hypothetical protein